MIDITNASKVKVECLYSTSYYGLIVPGAEVKHFREMRQMPTLYCSGEMPQIDPLFHPILTTPEYYELNMNRAEIELPVRVFERYVSLQDFLKKCF
ncbi:hypothetical protein KY337_06160 [Candidatus Woesearchaeota archaeon]|nr:hypothetical protein [Candidatus Woesearchaeota archaeon]